jgi:hypothetical protein
MHISPIAPVTTHEEAETVEEMPLFAEDASFDYNDTSSSSGDSVNESEHSNERDNISKASTENNSVSAGSVTEVDDWWTNFVVMTVPEHESDGIFHVMLHAEEAGRRSGQSIPVNEDVILHCKRETLKILMQAEKYPVLADMMKAAQRPWEAGIKDSAELQREFMTRGQGSIMTAVALAYYLDVSLDVYVKGGVFDFDTGDKMHGVVLYLKEEVNEGGCHDLIATKMKMMIVKETKARWKMMIVKTTGSKWSI